MPLPRGIRNNNFGNIEDGPFAQSLPGYAGTDGRFATFATPQDGLGAHSELLRRYGAKGINTLQGVVNRWAPSSDGNDTGAYAGYVGSKLGVGPNDPIDLNDPAVRAKISQHMAEFENGPSAMTAALQGQGADGGDLPTSAQPTAGYTSPPQGLSTFAGPGGNTPPAKGAGPDWDKALMGAATSLMAIGDPKGAAVLTSMQNANKDQWHNTTLPDGRVIQTNARTGETRQITSAQKQSAPLNETGLKHLIETESKANGTDWFNKQAEGILGDFQSGKLDVGLVKNWINSGRNLAGISTEQSQALARFESFKQLLANEQLLRAKGVQTEGDAVRALQQSFGGNAAYDNKTATESLQRGIALGRNELDNAGKAYDAYNLQYPNNPVVQNYVNTHRERMKRYSTPADAAKPAADIKSLKSKYGLD